MGVAYQQVQRTVYYQFSTKNESFRKMHFWLKERGIQNNKFHLVLYDPDLAGIDPRDPRLSTMMKAKVLNECVQNYWYFIREVVRVPAAGSPNGKPYNLDRGNLALSYCACLNLNIFLELPRQVGKTTSTLCWYLWLFNFGTSSSHVAFLNKKLDDSKYNLSLLKDIRSYLPSYLQMDTGFNPDGTKSKGRDNVEFVEHPVNGNRIRTVASARNKTAAASLLRGRTVSLLYADEWAFIPYNKIVYVNMAPAFLTAANNAKQFGKPYGMIITTTPGILTTDEGTFAFEMKENATNFSETFFDLPYDDLMRLINTNDRSSFVYIRYTYWQLSKDEAWFRDACIQMQLDWVAIRREILLEWSQTTENSPFRKEDLDIIKGLVKQPIQQILMLNKYVFNIYEQVNLRYPPLIGVDVSGGYQRDSSAITVVDSYSTRVTAELNCNYISTPDLAAVLVELVTKYMPNAVVNVERNGGFGASVLAKLVKSPIKKNLFWTIKDKIIEERVMGAKIQRRTQKTKVYGSDSTKAERENLMEILRDRVEYHKDKIISPLIYEELCGLEVKKSGKIEHSDLTHDDQIFSWLWALYMYYNGNELMENWGITRRVLKTDQDLEEAVYDVRSPTQEIVQEMEFDEDEDVQDQLSAMNGANGMLYNEWVQREFEKDQESMNRLLSTKLGRMAYNSTFNVDTSVESESAFTNLPDSVFNNAIIDEEGQEKYDPYNIYDQPSTKSVWW